MTEKTENTVATKPKSATTLPAIFMGAAAAAGLIGLGAFLGAQSDLSPATQANTAASTQTIDTADRTLPSALESLGVAGMEVEKRFATEVDGIEGLVVSVDGKQNLVYSMDDGRHVLIGMLLAEGGINLTDAHAKAHINGASEPATKALPERDSGINAESAISAVESLPFVVEEGSGDTILYVTLDPNCPHCSNYYRASRSVLDDVTIRWVPVGFLGRDSLRQAALLAESDDPVAAIAEMEARGLQGQPSAEALETIQENSLTMREAGITMTPVTVYRSADGTPRVVRGSLPAEQIRSLR